MFSTTGNVNDTSGDVPACPAVQTGGVDNVPHSDFRDTSGAILGHIEAVLVHDERIIGAFDFVWEANAGVFGTKTVWKHSKLVLAKIEIEEKDRREQNRTEQNRVE